MIDCVGELGLKLLCSDRFSEVIVPFQDEFLLAKILNAHFFYRKSN